MNLVAEITNILKRVKLLRRSPIFETTAPTRTSFPLQSQTRISGLDPAGPLFTNDVPYPFDRLHVSPDARLGPHDADIVDCVHTDGHARYLGWIPQVNDKCF